MDRPHELRNRAISSHGRVYLLHRPCGLQELQQEQTHEQSVIRQRDHQSGASRSTRRSPFVSIASTIAAAQHNSQEEHLIHSNHAQHSIFCPRFASLIPNDVSFGRRKHQRVQVFDQFRLHFSLC